MELIRTACLVSLFILSPILKPEILEAQTNYTELRQEMVEYQLRRRGISDSALLSVMNRIERHRFVPADIAHLSYNDSPLSIGYGQTISQPYIVGYMTEILELKPTDRVLEVGTGSGYQAAILAEMCDSVFSVEVVPQLGKRASLTLRDLGYENVKVQIGDGYLGWASKSPFDAIIVTCAPSHVPTPLKQQLKEGGRMIIPIGKRYIQELVLLKKEDGKLKQKAVLSVLFVPMVDDEGERY